MSSQLQAEYDRFADRYDSIFQERQQGKLIQLAAYIPRPWPRPALDVGAGTGLASRTLNHGFINLDVSSRMLAHAPAPRVIASAERLPFVDRCFGLILCVSVIERRLSAETVLRECDRVLTPGGHLALSLLKSEDQGALESALQDIFGGYLRRIDLGPDVGFLVQKGALTSC